MSGSVFEWNEYRLEELADKVILLARTPRQRAFGKHLKMCAAAAIALSRVLEGDDSPGDEFTAIDAVLAPGVLLASVIDDAHEAAKDLRSALEEACAGNRRA